jgi:DNA-binding response OmpR family regulator
LVVEDDAAAADLVVGMLSTRWEVQVAANVPDAVERFEELRPDLLILDLRLADGKNGIDVFQAIRRRIGHSPRAILVSGADEVDDTARALHVPVMRKPLRQRPLIDLVNRVLSGH